MSDIEPRMRSPIGTAEVARAAGVTERTVLRWVQTGLLPAPKVVYGGEKGKRTFWPDHAAEQAAWVRTQLDSGRTFEEILSALAAGEFVPPVRKDRA